MTNRVPLVDPADARATSAFGNRHYDYYRIDKAGAPNAARLPYTIKVLIENMLRAAATDDGAVSAEDVRALASWDPNRPSEYELPFMPSRVITHDYTGIPAVVDLAAMRDAFAAMGGDPTRINPLVPADLVIDHSVQVDSFGTERAFAANADREYERNGERYALLRWAQGAFRNLRVVPPGTGIVHQVNLEYLASVVEARRTDSGSWLAFPDTLVGTDSHTTMINALGVVGWGVGGIEAEAALLGQPLYQPMPVVVGFRLDGDMAPGSTATDLVLYVTEMLRAHGVVGKFVEFHGPGLSRLSLADRATIANMSPEFGATATVFPIDQETLRYLCMTGRPNETVARVEWYSKAQGLFRTDASPEPIFNESLSLDLREVRPSVAGPRRPQDRVALSDLRASFHAAIAETLTSRSDNGAQRSSRDETGSVPIDIDGVRSQLRHGAVVIAAITSCTNTSNPGVMVAAGLVAQHAVALGLRVPRYVKTSLAPGSRVVTSYLDAAGLTAPLNELGFNLVGYGCTTCIGNSGPLAVPIAQALEANDLVGVAVLSGNRNFEGRIHPLVRASYLASPPLVIAFALAGRIDISFDSEPIGIGTDGQPVYLRDVWPTSKEVADVIAERVTAQLFVRNYSRVFDGDERWANLDTPNGDRYAWDDVSTYVSRPPFLEAIKAEPEPVLDIEGARVLVMLGDSVTTDHISPAGSIASSSPAAEWLAARNVPIRDFNTYGSRRGHHEVMMRGTFANVRLRNAITPNSEGNITEHLPSGERMSIFDAAQRYAADRTPLIILAGKEYGSGSSRDWAAKGPLMLGVRAVIAESYERIHRANLVGMGILPLSYLPGENAETLGLTGRETLSINGLQGEIRPRQELSVTLAREDGSERQFQVVLRLDGLSDVEYFRHGGLLPLVLRRIAAESQADSVIV